MRLFYYPSNLKLNDHITFDQSESKHITKVLRLSKGDHIHVTAGLGKAFKAEITDDHFNQCQAIIIDQIAVAPPNRPYFHLCVAPPKSKQRWEWLLEKTTEIGVDEITPVICAKNERKSIDLKRSQLMLINALKQSQQVQLPKLNAVSNFDNLVAQPTPDLKLIAHCDEDQPHYQIDDFKTPFRHITIFIGPEGDFTEEEIQFALKNDYFAISLGENRLRTETAAIVAAQIVASIRK